MNFQTYKNYNKFPKASEPSVVEVKTQEWLEYSDKLDSETKSFMENFANSKEGKALFGSIFGNSSYLTQIIFKNIEYFKFFSVEGFESGFNEMIEDLTSLNCKEINRNELMKQLRIAKQKCALLVGIADITQEWDLDKVTFSLSKFADLCIKICTNFLLITGEKNNILEIKNKDKISEGSGLIILALGKLGSQELNYSSDIDLIVFFDQDNNSYIGKQSAAKFFSGFTTDLVSLMQTRTEDGYVFRTDIRLRPDPSSTPPAISLKAAENYYQTVGQNWERAAMIKARPVAGDDKSCKLFMDFIQKYVWRKYLDFASIQDVHSIKRQIDNKIGKLPENLFGYNIKLGHGGIREIEFFVQTQQLIWGGKEISIRKSSTCETLRALKELNKISEDAREEMENAYVLYRNIEHRLQMIADEQTHTFPENPEDLEKVAIFSGYKSSKEFVSHITENLITVKKHYSQLFEQSPSLTSGLPGIDGSLVFTGIENDPETLKTLTKMGFEYPETISEIIRGWHHGRRRATRTKRAREMLTELVPTILRTFSSTVNPNIAFRKFDEFLGDIPAGVQLFSLCHANPQLIALIADIMGGYPYLANGLRRNPAQLEYVLSKEFYKTLPKKELLEENLIKALEKTSGFEEMLDETRGWAHDRQFRIGIQLIKNKISTENVSKHLTDIADVVLTVTLEQVFDNFRKNYGSINGYGFSIVAMGKLGSSELTFGSDIDLVFVYGKSNDKFEEEKSDLSPNEYFSRLSRRFISAISALTTQGKVYDIDTRLRPSGKDGAVATNIESFINYYNEDAWSWELMALTRARVICGSKTVCGNATEAISNTFKKDYEKTSLVEHLLDMRGRVADDRGTENTFDVKYVGGGILDLEYVVQFLQLLHGKKHPEVLLVNTQLVIKELLKSKLITEKDAKELINASTLYQNVQSVMRLMDSEREIESKMTPGMKNIISQTTHSKSFENLKKNLEKSQKNVQKMFHKYISS